MKPNMTNHDGLYAYGYIALNDLHPDVQHTLLYEKGKDLSYEAAVVEETARQEQEFQDALDSVANYTGAQYLVDQLRDEFEPQMDEYDPMIDEPIIEGEYEGVHYRTSWLGGACNVWIFKSPFVGGFRPCSPCVPGAADLGSPDENGILGYMTPPDWLDDHIKAEMETFNADH